MEQTGLDAVQEGDQVIRQSSRGNLTVHTVVRLTPTQVHLGYSKYRKSDGMQIGTGERTWLRDYIYPATEENLARFGRYERALKVDARKRKIIQWLKRVRWVDYKLVDLQKIAQAAGYVAVTQGAVCEEEEM